MSWREVTLVTVVWEATTKKKKKYRKKNAKQEKERHYKLTSGREGWHIPREGRSKGVDDNASETESFAALPRFTERLCEEAATAATRVFASSIS
jgi:hypothetical protein